MAIRRFETNARMSQAVVHGQTVYLAGQVGTGNTVGEQTRSALSQIDALLAKAGTDKAHILTTQIWLADMADFAGMNEVWDSWVEPGATPARATGQIPLAGPEYRVEIIVVAALP